MLVPFSFLGAAPFDMADIAWTAWFRDYPGSSPWSGRASAGASGDGSHDATSTDVPTSGTLNSLNIADFNGTSDNASLEGTLDSYAAGTVCCGFALVNSDASQSKSILEATNFLVDIRTTPSARLLINGGAANVSKSFTHGSWQLITWRYDGTNAQVGVNEAPGASGGGSTAAYSTAFSSLAGTVRMGWNGGASFYDGKIAEVGITDTILTDADYANIKDYLNTRYALSL
jgi:hypothetical protein